MYCTASVERLRVLYCATPELPPSGMANMSSGVPQDGKGRDVRLLRELAKLLPGCGRVLKDAKQTALLGKTKVNKFNTNFRADTSKSAWTDHIDHFIAAWHGLQICWELGIPLGRGKFQCPKSNLWETAGFGGLGGVGRNGTASLCISREPWRDSGEEGQNPMRKTTRLLGMLI